jgi:hypothetical protein
MEGGRSRRPSVRKRGKQGGREGGREGGRTYVGKRRCAFSDVGREILLALAVWVLRRGREGGREGGRGGRRGGGREGGTGWLVFFS